MKTISFPKGFQRFVISLLFVAYLPFASLVTAKELAISDQAIQLSVDTRFDINDAGHQACTWFLPNDCSLRGAISKANADQNQSYQIVLPTGGYSLSIPGVQEDANATGDLDIHSDLLISGAGANSTRIDAQDIDRVFQTFPGIALSIEGVTITGGKTMDGIPGDPGGDSEDGGGFYNNGILALTDSIVIANQTGTGGPGISGHASGGSSGKGGGIYTTNSLILKNTQLLDNRTGDGGYGSSPGPGVDSCGYGGMSGDGGAIFSIGNVRLEDSLLSGNLVGRGGSGGDSGYKSGHCPDGQGGSGGGIYSAGDLRIQGSVVSNNQAGTGGGLSFEAGKGGGIYSTGLLEMSQSQILGNTTGSGLDYTPGGSGGGINTQGMAIISESLVDGNLTGDGGHGSTSFGVSAYDGYSSGHGGGIANSGSLILENTVLKSNRTGTGGDASGYNSFGDPVSGGAGGAGGGLYTVGTAEIWNCPITENATGGGGRAVDRPSDDVHWIGGMGGSGGGIYNAGDLRLSYSPVVSNTAGQGGPGFPNPGHGGLGGGIFNGGSLVAHFSPVTSNLAGTGGPDGAGPDGKGGDGGGIYNASSLDLLGGIITRNQAGSGGSLASYDGDGGAIYSSDQATLTLANAILADNRIEANGYGSGLFLESSASLVHTTLARNTGGDGSGIYFNGPSLMLTNTILVSQTVGITSTIGSINLDSTLWGSGVWANQADWGGPGSHTSIHELFADPGFADPSNDDYHIMPSSSAIDQGVPTSVQQDVDDQPRPDPSTNIPDLGADEFWLFVPISEAAIANPSPVSAGLAVTLTASISPTNATPNFAFNWSPHPIRGQGSMQAVYVWPVPGVYTITVEAWNTGSTATASAQFGVVFGSNSLFFPVIGNSIPPP